MPGATVYSVLQELILRVKKAAVERPPQTRAESKRPAFGLLHRPGFVALHSILLPGSGKIRKLFADGPAQHAESVVVETAEYRFAGTVLSSVSESGRYAITVQMDQGLLSAGARVSNGAA